jgi:hypothetical protein
MSNLAFSSVVSRRVEKYNGLGEVMAARLHGSLGPVDSVDSVLLADESTALSVKLILSKTVR